LNNPDWVFETGSRTLMMDEKKLVKVATGENYFSRAKSVNVDHLNFELNELFDLAYRTAAKIESSRFTEILILNAIRGKHAWKEGELIS
jgi:hypothetical protein